MRKTIQAALLALLLPVASFAAQQTILGTDTLPQGRTKLNSNFTELYGLFPVAVNNGGTGATSATNARSNLGLVIGTNVQAWDADLDSISLLSPTNDDVLQRKSGAWTNRSIAQLKTDIGTVATATALAANGANCSAGSYPLGVDESGAVENCTAALALGDTPTWTGVHTWSLAEPRLRLSESDQTTNETLWDVDLNGKVLAFRTRTDADGAGVNWLAVTRGTGTAISNITFGNATNNPGFTFSGSGLVTGSTGGFTTTGPVTGGRLTPTSSTGGVNSINLPATNTLGMVTNSALRLWADTYIGVAKGGVTMSSTERANVGGVSYTNTTQTGNTAATETDAFSHTLTANTLGSNGESIEFEAAGTFAATASTDKRVKVVFGSTTLFDSGALATTGGTSWSIRGTIVRTGATTQKANVSFNSSYATLNASAAYTAPTETLANALTLKLTLNGTNANDTVGQFFKEKWFPFL